MSWRDINRRIGECKKFVDPSDRLACLFRLWDKYKETDRDGMVAYAIGEEYENQNQIEEALKYYKEAERRFPLPEYKGKARNAITRVQMKIEEQEKIEAFRPVPTKIDLTQLDPKNTLFIVACSKTKIWNEDPDAPSYVPARHAYRGKNFREFIKWLDSNEIESKQFRWLILSAKYGYIEPWHPIGNYDVTFDDEKTGPISDETLYSQVMFQKRWKNDTPLSDFKVVVCFGGKTYIEKVRKSFRDTSTHIIEA